jgi:hypothetical protein
VRPAKKSWEISEVPFAEVLEEVKSEFIVALGYRLGDMLPGLTGHAGPLIESAPEPNTWIYPYRGGRAMLFNIKHPSSGFSPPEWHKYILMAEEKAKELKNKHCV